MLPGTGGDAPALYLECLPMQQSICHGFVCTLQNPAEGRPRDIHFGGSLFLLISFEIGQPERFQFVQ
jgi:hypothetical protein